MAEETHQVEAAHAEGGHASLKTYVIIGAILTIVTAIEVAIYYIPALSSVEAPLLIAQGGADTLITPAAQDAYVTDRCTDGQQVDDADVLPEVAQQRVQPLDPGDPPRAPGALEDGRGVVAMGQRLGAPGEGRLRPSREEVTVGPVVHDVHRPRPRGAGTDLAEDGLTGRGPEPLHVGEAGREAQGLQHLAPHRPPVREVVGVQVPQRHGHRADPLVAACLERLGQVPADVLEEHVARTADGVVGVLLPLDELLDADPPDMAEHGQHLRELLDRVDPVGVGRPRPRHRLDNERIADLLGRLPDLVRAHRGPVPGRADPGVVQDLLHHLLVAEGPGLLHRHPRDAQVLPDLCGQLHVGLPQAFHLVDRGMPRQTAQGGQHRGGVGQGDVLVVGQVLAGLRGQRVRGHVTHADDAGPGPGQRPGEVGLLQREARGDHDDVHGIPLSGPRPARPAGR